MIGIIVISESKAGKEMLKTVCKVLDEKKLKQVRPITFKAKLSAEQRQKTLKKQIEKMDRGDGVLIFTELYGATQTNICKTIHASNAVAVVCGYNLPMLIEAVSLSAGEDLEGLSKKVEDIGRKYIRRVACAS